MGTSLLALAKAIYYIYYLLSASIDIQPLERQGIRGICPNVKSIPMKNGNWIKTLPHRNGIHDRGMFCRQHSIVTFPLSALT